MRSIELDATHCSTIDDVFDALRPALGAPDWHGRTMNALIDSIGTGAINVIEPPYEITIAGAGSAAGDVREFLTDLRTYVMNRVAEPNPLIGPRIRRIVIRP